MESSEIKFDFLNLWTNTHYKEDTSRFISNEECFMKYSIVFRSLKDDFEQDRLFSSKGVKYLQKLEEGHENVKKKEAKNDVSLNYIPGYSPLSYIRSKSCLTRDEMSECYTLFVQFKNKKLSEDGQKRFSVFRDRIVKEQQEYLELVRYDWESQNYQRHKNISPEVEKFINSYWKARRERISEYPKFYSQVGLYSLVSSNKTEVEMVHVKTLRTLGTPPFIYFPKLNMFKANTHSIIGELNDQVERKECNKALGINYGQRNKRRKTQAKYSALVSQDEIAENLADKFNAQIVVSASGFLKLINNHYPTFESSWDLPITVKEYKKVNGEKKTIVFIDKALPPQSLNMVERNQWFGKISNDYLHRHKQTTLRFPTPKNDIVDLETFGFDCGPSLVPQNKPSKQCKCQHTDSEAHEETDVKDSGDESANHTSFSDVESDIENRLIIDEENSPKRKETTLTDTLKIANGNKSPGLLSKKCNCKENESIKKVKASKPVNVNVTYSLWKVKRGDHSYLSKMSSKELNVIIRCKEGYFYKKEKRKYRVAAKLEYQPEYGGEALTLSEITKHWGSIFIRPDTNLALVRLNPLDGELIMSSPFTLSDLKQEGLRLHNVNLSNTLGTFYSVIERLSSLQPGRYLMSHQPKNEAFAPLYRETQGNCMFNLSQHYGRPETDVAPERSQWNPIDVMVLTPTSQYFRRLPAMFVPTKVQANKKGAKKVTLEQVKKRPKKKPGKKAPNRKRKRKAKRARKKASNSKDVVNVNKS